MEDDLVNQEIASLILRQLGFEVSAASDGYEALAHVEREVPHVILVDCQLPGIDGFETTRRLRKLERTTDVPVVAMTESVSAEDRRKCREAGMDEFLGKPLVIEELR